MSGYGTVETIAYHVGHLGLSSSPYDGITIALTPRASNHLVSDGELGGDPDTSGISRADRQGTSCNPYASTRTSWEVAFGILQLAERRHQLQFSAIQLVVHGDAKIEQRARCSTRIPAGAGTEYQ